MAELFDCWFVEGELDWKNSYGNQYIKNDKSRQYEVSFESGYEMDKWLNSVIVSKKYDIVKKGN